METQTTVNNSVGVQGNQVANESGGFLDHIKVEPSPADKPMNTDETSSTKTATSDETHPDESKLGEKTTQQQPFSFDTAEVVVRGRKFTGNDLVKAYENSSDEGMRLNKINKQLQNHIAELEKQYLELQIKLEETPPFKILTEEEVNELPIPKQIEYFTQKQKWEADKAARKEQLAKIQEMEAKSEEETKAYVMARSEYMLRNTDKWYDYDNLIPVMEQIIEVAPFLTGYRETPDIVYYAALGLRAYRQEMEKRALEKKSAKETNMQANAQISAIGTNSTQSPTSVPNAISDDDKSFQERILKKVQKPLFK